MTKVTYEIVEHDGGWAYRVDGAYSETYRSHDAARQGPEYAGDTDADRGERHEVGETLREEQIDEPDITR